MQSMKLSMMPLTLWPTMLMIIPPILWLKILNVQKMLIIRSRVNSQDKNQEPRELIFDPSTKNAVNNAANNAVTNIGKENEVNFASLEPFKDAPPLDLPLTPEELD